MFIFLLSPSCEFFILVIVFFSSNLHLISLYIFYFPAETFYISIYFKGVLLYFLEHVNNIALKFLSDNPNMSSWHWCELRFFLVPCNMSNFRFFPGYFGRSALWVSGYCLNLMGNVDIFNRWLVWVQTRHSNQPSVGCVSNVSSVSKPLQHYSTLSHVWPPSGQSVIWAVF